FYRSHLGSIRPVIFEENLRDGLLFGHTDNYIKVGVSAELVSPGEIITVQLDQLDEKGRMVGSLTTAETDSMEAISLPSILTN
ncbi:MAG: hypothetical protein ACKO1U_08450, partial [Bacteroidota bacterium]